MGDGTFRIVIGDGWRAAAAGAETGGGRRGIDPAGVRGSVDIVVGGERLQPRADEDSVFFLVQDLLAAVERLSDGDGSARVGFHETPHELVLQRIGPTVFLTFFRAGQIPEVLVRDQRVPFAALRDGVVTSARELRRDALELDPGLAGDPLMAWMGAAVKRLARIRIPEGPGPATPPLELVESTRFAKARGLAGFSFGFRFAASATDLLAPGRPLGNDLASLLFRGQLAVHARERRRALGEGFLFLQVEKLLASVRQLLAAWEEGRPMSLRLIAEGLVLSVRLEADDRLVVGLHDREHDDSILVAHDLTPWEYADAVLGVARELRRKIVDLAPSQRRNLRLETFSREVRALAIWAREQRRGAVINRDVEPYRRVAERHQRRDPADELGGEPNRLSFRERWRIEAEGLDIGGTMLCGGLALVSARGFVLGVETASGQVAWRRETDRSEARLQVAGRDGAARVTPGGQVELIDLQTGSLRWHARLAPRAGGAPVLLVVDHGPVPGLVIAAEEERRLVALDLRTGEPRWRHSVHRGGRFALRRHGRLLYVAGSDNQFSAVDVEDGSLVWLYPGRVRFQLPPGLDGETLIVPGGRPGKPDGRLFGLHAFSGEVRWETALGGGALTAPIVADGVALLPVRANERHDLVAVDTSSGEILWRLPCSGWAESCALMALDDRFIVNAAGGVLRCLGARDGLERWTTTLGPTCSDDTPLNLRICLRGGVLFVPADTVYLVRPDNGQVLHSLGGDPPVPDLLHVDPELAIFVAEESGHLAMFEASRRLRVVEGGA
jgi:outer membrane protein assembly factor BamB